MRTEDLQRQLNAGRRLLAIDEAKTSLLTYMRLKMPHPDFPDDPEKSQYEITPQAFLLCQIIEKMHRGEMHRVGVSIGPQLGKSEVLTRAGPAWLSGHNPYRNIMVGAYNQTFAEEFGGDVRTIMNSNAHKAVFPKHALRRGGEAKDFLVTDVGGKLSFVGVGGSGTGKPADFFFVDDPVRNDEDAQSAAYREKVWKWFTSVTFSRLLSKSGVLVVHTRWHGDDLLGRLCDPEHPERNKSLKGIADRWTYINIPAVVDDPKLAKALNLKLEVQTDKHVVSMFGTKPIAALSPTRKSLTFLAEAKQLDVRAFNALYMGKPTPDDGEYFTKDMLIEYSVDELPRELKMYGASDHAVGQKQRNDYSVLGCVGVDASDDIWLLPDIIIDRLETDRTVEEMIAKMKTHSPVMWWMESELISKSFGPFLRKRMAEEKVYTYLDPVVPSKDKVLRARAIQGRMAMRKVHFPKFAHWWPNMKAQILRFPYSPHDDFVDFIAHIGAGLLKEIRASKASENEKNVVRSGSIEWILRNAKARARKAKRAEARKGW